MFQWNDGWGDWYPLKKEVIKNVPAEFGAYVIATDRKLTRLVGIDSEGIIDIGETSNLKTRIQSFLRCAATKEEKWGHMAGVRYRQCKFKKIFPLCTLKFRWVVKNNKVEAKREEARKMAEYFSAHWELPPLNFSFNRKIYEFL